MSYVAQMKKEDDPEIKEVMKTEIIGMINKLLEQIRTEAPAEEDPKFSASEVQSTGVDWMLLDLLKWTIAYD